MLALALASLVVCLAGAGAYLAFHSSGALREARVLSGSVEVAQKLLLTQYSLQGYLATGKKDFLSNYRAALGAFATATDALKDACAAIEEPPDRTAQNAVESLVRSLQEWQSAYADPAVRLKSGKTKSDTALLASMRRKGTGAVHDQDVGNFLDALKNFLNESALPRFQSRIAVRKRLSLLTVLLGLAGFLGAGAAFLRARQALLDDLRSRSSRLGELARYADRMHHLVNTDQAAKLLAVAVGSHAARASVLLRLADGTGLRIAATTPTAEAGSQPVAGGVGGPVPAAEAGSNPIAGGGGAPVTSMFDAPLLTDPAVCPVMRTGHRFVIRDPAADPPCDCPFAVLREGGYACLPLQAQARTTGLVNWQAPPGRRLRTADLDRIEELSRVTSLALTNLVSLEGATHEAVTDQLTGVSNRRFLDGYLAKQFQAALRQGRPLGVLMLDLDRFKAFNDANGHQAGDALLRTAASAAGACVREGDLVARYGGEEFAVVLPDADAAGALEIAERIRAAIEEMRVDGLPGMKPPVITVSIGLAVAPGDGRTVQALVRAADEALYAAKELGRNRIVSAPASPAA